MTTEYADDWMRELATTDFKESTNGDDDRLGAYSAMIHGLDAANDRFGDEDWGDWKETAVDPRDVDDSGSGRSVRPRPRRLARRAAKTAARPWLVLSNDSHPFHGEEYLVAGLTTTERTSTIQLRDEDWIVGGLPQTSYVSPWFLTTLKHAAVDRGVGMITDEAFRTVAKQIADYTGGTDV